MKHKTTRKGFTLIEIVIVITLTSIIMVTIFRALDRVRQNESKFDRQRESEKEVYLLSHRLDNMFKNTSSFKVFNNRDQSVYFLGRVNDVIFLTRAPLVSPYTSLHFVEVRIEGDRVLYREKPFSEPQEGDFISFEELDDEPFYTLMESVENAGFQYFFYDAGTADFEWKTTLNTFENDPLPIRVFLELTMEGKDYNLFFQKVIRDENVEIPEYLFNK